MNTKVCLELIVKNNDHGRYLDINSIALFEFLLWLSPHGRHILQQDQMYSNLIFVDFDNSKIIFNSLMNSIDRVVPALLREGFTVKPTVSFEDIDGLEDVKTIIRSTVCAAITTSDFSKRFNLPDHSGLLFYGPPGCGKTLMAQAIAKETGANYIAVSAPDIMNKYVGESEKTIRQIFERARAAAPVVLFIDEIDAICPERGTDLNGSTNRIVASFLTELCGVKARSQVHVIAATNKVETLDQALIRAGRLETHIFFPPPSENTRLKLLSRELYNFRVSANTLNTIAISTEGYSCARVSAIGLRARVLARDYFLASSKGILEAVFVREEDVLKAFEESKKYQDVTTLSNMKSPCKRPYSNE